MYNALQGAVNEENKPRLWKVWLFWGGADGYADRLSHSFRGVKRLRLQDYERGIVGNDPCVVPQAGCQECFHSPISPSSVACGATFPTRGKAATVIPLRLETASELRWNGRDVSTVRPPSSVAGAPPSPSKGKATAVERAFYVLPFILLSNRRYFKILRNATAVERNFLCSTSQSYRKIGAVSNGYEPP